MALGAPGNWGLGGGGSVGGGGMDPVTGYMIASAVSGLLGGMFGGGDSPQERLSFKNEGMASPVNSLKQALTATHKLGAGLTSRGPTRLRSSYAPPPIEPVSIPGLPFQIGGGLGRDPALDNPALLEGQQDLSSMFGGLFSPFMQQNEQAAGARRRTPTGNAGGSIY